MSGTQTDSCNLQRGLLLGKTTQEASPKCRNSGSPGTLELSLVGLNIQASVCPRSLLRILVVTERHRLDVLQVWQCWLVG
jgi:hypothetical protein